MWELGNEGWGSWEREGWRREPETRCKLGAPIARLLPTTTPA